LVFLLGEFAMAEMKKLSAGKALEKIRSSEAKDNRSGTEKLDDKIKTLEEEVQRLRVQTRRLRRGRGAGSTGQH